MTGPIIIAFLIVFATVLILTVLARMFRKVGPNQALIVYGLGGTQIVQGGGKIVWPMIQTARELSLELMSFDVAPQQDLYTAQGVAVTVEAVAQIKVKSDPESVRTAAEQFLNKTPEERETALRLVMEGHLRGIIGQLTVEQIVKEPEMVADRMRANVADDMSKMGLEVISFTLKEVRDKNEYIINMGKPDIARIRREADIAAAEAERDTAIKRAQAQREAAVAKALADQETVIAQTASQVRQAEAQRDLQLKQAEYAASVAKQKAEADKAYDVQAAVMDQQVTAEKVRVQRVEREEQIKVQEAEILRRERELVATVLKAAEVEKQRIEALAQAEKQRLAIEAAGRAEALKAQGMAEADVVRARGAAEADAIRAKGQAEADAMHVRATAFQEYNQAAVIDKLLSGMPDVVRAFAEPLSKVDRITIVSTGGEAAGVNKLTADVAKMVAQAPALFESLAGVSVAELLKGIPALREVAAGKDEGATADGRKND